jgi:hypothetical protein
MPRARAIAVRKMSDLRLFRDPHCLGAAVTACELLDPARRIDKLLFPRKKRMTSGTDADLNILARRTRVINRTARTSNIGLEIFWMNVRFHVWKRARNLALLRTPRKP